MTQAVSPETRRPAALASQAREGAPDLFSAVPAPAPRLTASCMICGAENAPHGLRRPGHFSKLKPGKRFVLFHCGGAECAAEAAARLAAADAPAPSRPIRHRLRAEGEARS